MENDEKPPKETNEEPAISLGLSLGGSITDITPPMTIDIDPNMAAALRDFTESNNYTAPENIFRQNVIEPLDVNEKWLSFHRAQTDSLREHGDTFGNLLTNDLDPRDAAQYFTGNIGEAATNYAATEVTRQIRRMAGRDKIEDPSEWNQRLQDGTLPVGGTYSPGTALYERNLFGGNFEVGGSVDIDGGFDAGFSWKMQLGAEQSGRQ